MPGIVRYYPELSRASNMINIQIAVDDLEITRSFFVVQGRFSSGEAKVGFNCSY
jgi:hypothetical protein